MKTKRLFDLSFSMTALLILGFLLLLFIFLATIDTCSCGVFKQKRIGLYGKQFIIYKIKTVKDRTTTISIFGSFLRRYKIDELPQLFNIFLGQMSFVGPRPDIAGYYNSLQGEERLILQLKPGLTSEASLKYFDEEVLLKKQKNPKEYNDTVIFPDKVKLNLHYYYNHSLLGDLKIIYKTLLKYIQ